MQGGLKEKKIMKAHFLITFVNVRACTDDPTLSRLSIWLLKFLWSSLPAPKCFRLSTAISLVSDFSGTNTCKGGRGKRDHVMWQSSLLATQKPLKLYLLNSSYWPLEKVSQAILPPTSQHPPHTHTHTSDSRYSEISSLCPAKSFTSLIILENALMAV